MAPETHSASGRQLNTVVLAMEAVVRLPRYWAASGTMLNSSFTFSAPTACWWRIVSPQFVFHRPKSLAYTPVKISRTNLAPVAIARSMEATGSQRQLTP